MNEKNITEGSETARYIELLKERCISWAGEVDDLNRRYIKDMREQAERIKELEYAAIQVGAERNKVIEEVKAEFDDGHTYTKYDIVKAVNRLKV